MANNEKNVTAPETPVIDEKEFDDPETDFIRYKDLQRNWREPYDGT